MGESRHEGVWLSFYSQRGLVFADKAGPNMEDREGHVQSQRAPWLRLRLPSLPMRTPKGMKRRLTTQTSVISS